MCHVFSSCEQYGSLQLPVFCTVDELKENANILGQTWKKIKENFMCSYSLPILALLHDLPLFNVTTEEANH